MAARQEKVPVEERLFSLVLALLATDVGLTKHEILSTVQGYRQQYREGGDNANLERQFERDKDNIRELGVPLETVEPPDEPGSNHSLRYLIPRGGYDLPADIEFSPSEVALLNLAAMVWREGSLSRGSQRALMKLRSLGIAPTEPVLGYAPRLRVRDAAFEPLNSALEGRQTVIFDYLKPGESVATVRIIEPLAIVLHEGRWHLFGREAGTEVTKTFLLRRIISEVHTTGAEFEPPGGDQAAVAIAELRELAASQVAVIDVVEGSDALRLGRRAGARFTESGALELPYTDAAVLADELAGFGPEVIVLSPPSLRKAVLERLKTVEALHG